MRITISVPRRMDKKIKAARGKVSLSAIFQEAFRAWISKEVPEEESDYQRAERFRSRLLELKRKIRELSELARENTK